MASVDLCLFAGTPGPGDRSKVRDGAGGHSRRIPTDRTLSFAGDEIQDENKTQKDDGHTQESDENYGTICALSVDVAHSGQ